MAQMLGKVGIKANVEVGEQSVYVTKWRQKQLLPVYMDLSLFDPGRFGGRAPMLPGEEPGSKAPDAE